MSPRSSEADPRTRVVEAAVRLLTEGGPEALQARKLAAEVGTSTMAVYTHFGGMPGVVEAVCEEGFRRLSEALAEVPQTDDPVADLFALGLAYRETALTSPHLYGVMFGLTAPGGRRIQGNDMTKAKVPVSKGQGYRAFGYLVDVARRAIEAGRFGPGEPFDAAAQLWSGLHGYVMLEIAGYFGDEGHGVEQVLGPLGTSLVIGLGDTPQAAIASARTVTERGV